MSLTMYQASAPIFLQFLGSLSKVLEKAAAHAEAKKIDPNALLTARLFPDMLAFTKQVQIVTDHAKGAMARLAGIEIRDQLRRAASSHLEDHRLRKEHQARAAQRL